MNLTRSPAPGLALTRPDGARRGSAVLVILVLLACLAMFIAANSSALHSLKQELNQIDQQQLKKYAPKK